MGECWHSCATPMGVEVIPIPAPEAVTGLFHCFEVGWDRLLDD